MALILLEWWQLRKLQLLEWVFFGEKEEIEEVRDPQYYGQLSQIRRLECLEFICECLNIKPDLAKI